MFKGFYRSAVLAMMALLSIGAQAAETAADVKVDQSNPFTLVEQVANKTFARFHQDEKLIAADPDHLKVIVTEELMPYIDYKYASYKVLGQYLRDTTKDQRNRFVEAFRGYLIATYAQAFTEYTEQTVEYAKPEDFAGEKFVNVNVQIVEQGRPAIKLQFKARRLKDGTWKAFDLIAEGVSLLSSKQSEITNLVRQQGIESVIQMLNERTQKHIELQSKEKQS